MLLRSLIRLKLFAPKTILCKETQIYGYNTGKNARTTIEIVISGLQLQSLFFPTNERLRGTILWTEWQKAFLSSSVLHFQLLDWTSSHFRRVYERLFFSFWFWSAFWWRGLNIYLRLLSLFQDQHPEYFSAVSVVFMMPLNNNILFLLYQCFPVFLYLWAHFVIIFK
jgi:hypothetical protein